MSVLTLSVVKDHLNIASGVTTYDVELQRFIDQAESAVRRRCGPLASVAVTERVRGGRSMLSVRETPIVSITSVTPAGGTALDVTRLSPVAGEAQNHAGVIEYADGRGCFSAARYVVVYQAGWAPLPEDLKLGTLELIRELWDSQLGGGSAKIGSGDQETASNTLPDVEELFTFQVERLIGPYEKVAI